MHRYPANQAYAEEENASSLGISYADLPIDRDYDIPTSANGAAPERASALLSQFDRKRRAAALVVPTSDDQVKARLRSLDHPITLFAEGPGERRDRLREVLLQELEAQSEDAVDTPMAEALPESQAQEDEEFYTEGGDELLKARQEIASYSLPRARTRVKRQKEENGIPLRSQVKFRKEVKEQLRGFELMGTQIVGDRPVSITRFSPDGKYIAAGTWSGSIKLFSVPDLEEERILRGHTGIIGGISWFPKAQGEDVVRLASSAGGQGGKNEIHLWNASQDTPCATLDGHTDRVCRIDLHPSGDYLASASFDTTWRLWDVRTQRELLLQEGHSRQVYTVSFNIDGSLLASGGFDSIGRIWDLRSGRTVMILEGHIREIYAMDWGVDGYRVLSGSGDGWMKCWDLRAVRQVGGVGAHNGNVSDLRWYKGDGADLAKNMDIDMIDGGPVKNALTHAMSGAGVDGADTQPRKAGTFVVSSGFDKQVNIFSADDWALAKQLSGHSGNVLSTDISADAKWIVSGGHDRTVKIWGRENGLGL